MAPAPVALDGDRVTLNRIVQAWIDETATRAAESARVARDLREAEMLLLPERSSMIALVDQLALANALKMIEMGIASGEITRPP